MSHLKKLSDRIKSVYSPKIYPIKLCGIPGDYTLQKKCNIILSLSKKILESDIPSLKLTASSLKTVSLSSPMIGLSSQIFVLHKLAITDKWEDYSAVPEDYLTFINPSVVKHTSNNVIKHEECPCIPNIVAEVERPFGIQLNYMDLDGILHTKDYFGFEARVILHEIDHLNGVLISNLRASKGKIHEKYKFQELDKVIQSYEEKTKEEMKKLEALYQKDKNFKSKCDSQPDKNEFYMKIILGTQKYEEYLKELARAIEIDKAKGKISYK